MQATRFHDEPGLTSGTFEAGAGFDRVEEAYRLALEIERLLTPDAPEGPVSESYGQRITRALARSLIDSLVDLKRDTRTKLV